MKRGRGSAHDWLGLRPLLLMTGAAGAAALAGCGEWPASAPPTSPPPAINHAPVIGPLPDTTTAVGDTLVMPISVADPDGDILSVWLVPVVTPEEQQRGYSPNARLVGRTSLSFWFAPGREDFPGRQFFLMASDLAGASDTLSLTVHVQLE